jgi:hypothetical protein
VSGAKGASSEQGTAVGGLPGWDRSEDRGRRGQ